MCTDSQFSRQQDCAVPLCPVCASRQEGLNSSYVNGVCSDECLAQQRSSLVCLPIPDRIPTAVPEDVTGKSCWKQHGAIGCWWSTAPQRLCVTLHHRLEGQWTVVPAAGAVPACLILATSFFFVQHGKTAQCIILLHPTPASPGRSAALTHHTMLALV